MRKLVIFGILALALGFGVLKEIESLNWVAQNHFWINLYFIVAISMVIAPINFEEEKVMSGVLLECVTGLIVYMLFILGLNLILMIGILLAVSIIKKWIMGRKLLPWIYVAIFLTVHWVVIYYVNGILV